MKRPVKLALWGAGILLGGILLCFLGLQAAISLAGRSLPPILRGNDFLEVVPQTSRVLASDGTPLAEYFVERRTVIPLDSVPDYLVTAILSVEDKDFLEHSGISRLAIFRAFVMNALALHMNQGGSTLTQQLAKNLYLTHERTLWRKLREAAIAEEMEGCLTKEEILFQYINLIYWGHGNFGVEEAARFYFGKPASSLSLSEATLLAGMIKGPEYLSPLKHPDKAQARQSFVVQQMERMGSMPEPGTSVSFPTIVGKRAVQEELSPYGVDAALVQLRPVIDADALLTGGYTITTSIQPDNQTAVNDAVDAMLLSLDAKPRLSSSQPDALCSCLTDGRLLPGCPAWALIRYTNLEGDLLVDLLGRPARVPIQAVSPPGLDFSANDLGPGTWIRVMPAQEVLLASPWDAEVPTAIPLLEPQVAALLVDAASGEILALYGGLDHAFHPFNRAISPAPSLSPLQVAEALRFQAGKQACVPSATIVRQVTRPGEPTQHEPRPCLQPPTSQALSVASGKETSAWFTWQGHGKILVVWVGSDEGRTSETRGKLVTRLGLDILRRLGLER